MPGISSWCAAQCVKVEQKSEGLKDIRLVLAWFTVSQWQT